MLGRVFLNLPATFLGGEAQVTHLSDYGLVCGHVRAARIAGGGDLTKEITAQVALNEGDDVEQD